MTEKKADSNASILLQGWRKTGRSFENFNRSISREQTAGLVAQASVQRSAGFSGRA